MGCRSAFHISMFFLLLLPVSPLSLRGEGGPPQKCYPLKNISAVQAEQQLRSLLSPEWTGQTVILIDEARNELYISGPPGALATIDILLSKLDNFNSGVSVGVLPSYGPAPRTAPRHPPVSGLPQNPMYQTPGNARPLSAPPHPGTPPAPEMLPASRAPVVPGVPMRSPTDLPEVVEPSSPAVYRCRTSGAIEGMYTFSAIEEQLRQQYGHLSDVSILTKQETEEVVRLCVIAPDSIQHQIGQRLRQRGLLLPPNDALAEDGTLLRIKSLRREERGFTSDSSAKNSPETDASKQPIAFTASRLPVAKLEETLQRLLAGRLLPAARAGEYSIAVERGEVRRMNLVVEPENNRFLLSGDAVLLEPMRLLLAEIDREQPLEGYSRRFISVHNADPLAVGKIFEAYGCRQRLVDRDLGNAWDAECNPDGKADREEDAVKRAHPLIRLVGYEMLAQSGMDLGGEGFDGEGFDGGGGLGDPNFQGSGNAPKGSSGMEVVPDFRYRIIPYLDVIVIDATGAEVKRFEEMIRQIEELSKIAEPKIEIYYLKHVNCVSLRWVIADRDVFNALFRTKQGSVTISPLVNPNAMLLIGWGKAFDAMKDLIETLDRPVAAENNMFRVIKLRHVSVMQALPLIRSAFPMVQPAGSGFAPRVNILSDQRTNSLILQAGPNDFREIERLIAEIDVSQTGPRLEVRSFKLRNSLASDLATVLSGAIEPGVRGTSDRKMPMLEMLVTDENGRRLLESGIMADVKITTDVRNNALVVTAPDHCMELLAKLIEMLDVPNATAEIKVFQVLHGDAGSIVETLKSLMPTQLDGQVGPALPGANEEDTLVPVRFAIDTRTNSLIASGSRGDLKIIEALFLTLDREEEQARKASVYKLRSSDAMNIAQSITLYLESKRKIQNDSPGAISAYQRLESEVVVIPERSSNTLLISATPRYYDEIIKVIEELDRQPPQVVIQVLIAEVTLGNTKELGAEIGIQDTILFDRSTFDAVGTGTKKTTITDGGVTTVIEEPVQSTGNPGWLFNETTTNSLASGVNAASAVAANTVGSQLLTNFATGRTSAEAGFGGIVFSANSDAISIMIRALQETSRLEVLSRPQIMSLDNQPAFIHVGQEVPRVDKITTTNYGTDASTTLDKVGLMLMVEPRISADDKVNMKVTAIKSSLGTITDGIPISYSGNREIRSPKINVIQTMTMVSASDNETVMLSGLITREDQKINRKVPLLGDIPLLGKLFQYNFDRCRKTELLIIMTPRIVRSEFDAERVKQIETARMSWCLNKVVDLHGDIGVYNPGAEIPVVGDSETYYPLPIAEEDLIPLEQLPVEELPGNGSSNPAPVPQRRTFPTPSLAPTLPATTP